MINCCPPGVDPVDPLTALCNCTDWGVVFPLLFTIIVLLYWVYTLKLESEKSV